MPSVRPRPPAEHRPKDAEPLLSPCSPSPQCRCRSSAGGTAPGAAQGQEHGRVYGERWQEGTRAALPGPTILSHQPRAGLCPWEGCPPLQTRGKPKVYQNSVYSKH